MTDPIAILFALGLGPWVFPCRGKIPAVTGWESFTPVDEARVREWVAMDFNLALRTGINSRVIVIDNDQPRADIVAELARHGQVGTFALPPTGMLVKSPTGSVHGYYRCPIEPPHNSASKLAPYVDVRGEGGYVMVPPSTHPDQRALYEWVATGEPGEIPAEILALMFGPVVERPVPAVEIDMRAPVHSGNGYVAAALHGEVHKVRNATQGSRNDTLNKAACALGSLVAGGVLGSETAQMELLAAALMVGLPESEATKTIASGLRGGAKSPRGIPPRSEPTRTATTTAEPATPPSDRAGVLVPGSHAESDRNEYTEQGTDTFCQSVLDALKDGAIYRRSSAIGELHDGQFVKITPDRMRSIIDSSIRLYAVKEGDAGSVPVFRTCTRDYAAVVLEYAARNGKARELNHIARYPVCVGAHLMPATPYWNPASGVYLDCASVPAPLPLDEARATLDDLVCDFPFATQADRENYFGLLVTVMVRPAIGEPVPMHMIGASVMGSGKSKLAEIVLGCGLLGRPLPATQIGDREDERQKQITAGMVGGDSVIHLDNLSGILDSPALASLLTCAVYRGRLLGHSTMLAIPNDSVLIGSGNNTHTSDEIARRIIPIILQPNTESPENRQDYRHPQLRAYVEEQLPRTRGALLGLVEHWRTAGQRQVGARSVGSFERWSAVVGGIMAAAGYDKWLTNLTGWRGAADDFSAELRAFVKLWAELHSDWWIGTDALFELADKNDLFARQIRRTDAKGRQTEFNQRVLSAVANRIVGQHRIEVEGAGRSRRARLVQTGAA